MKIFIVFLSFFIVLLSFYSCKKTYTKYYVYCTENCKEISGRILTDTINKKPLVGITILINDVEYGSGGLFSTERVTNLGYFKTNELGIFKAKINAVNFQKSYITVLKYNYNASIPITLGTLKIYPDTIPTFYSN